MLVTDPLNPVSWAEVQQRKGVSVYTIHTFSHLSIRATFKYLGNLSYSSSPVGSDHTAQPITLSLAHHCSVLGSLLIIIRFYENHFQDFNSEFYRQYSLLNVKIENQFPMLTPAVNMFK